MKKLLSFLVVLTFVAAMFVSSVGDKKSIDINLSSIMTLNTANAEDGGIGIICKCRTNGTCRANGNQDKCASFEGNGFCSDYDGNCGIL